MGVYVNPPNQDKVAWLEQNGVKFYEFSEAKYLQGKDDLIVATKANASFVAAAVLYNDGEEKEFTLPDDPRPTVFFVVPIEKLLPVACGLSRCLMADKE